MPKTPFELARNIYAEWLRPPAGHLEDALLFLEEFTGHGLRHNLKEAGIALARAEDCVLHALAILLDGIEECGTDRAEPLDSSIRTAAQDCDRELFRCETLSGREVIERHMRDLLDVRLQLLHAAAWRFRDAVEHQRGRVEEVFLEEDQTAAILREFDESIGRHLPQEEFESDE
jgi:hypothetical protein